VRRRIRESAESKGNSGVPALAAQRFCANLPIPTKPPVYNGMIAPRDSWMMPPLYNEMIPPGAPRALA
jgi:hypothetical protein